MFGKENISHIIVQLRITDILHYDIIIRVIKNDNQVRQKV